jgi:sugar lactone lactonase YvrE
MTWIPLGTETFQLGESPFWHTHEQVLYWVDIPGKKIARMLADGTLQTWDMPTEAGCIAPAASGGLVIARRDGIFRARTWGGELQRIATLPYDTVTVRANDGKCDALGRFWVGTMDEPKAKHAAALFSIDGRKGSAQVQQHAGNALIGNGLAWSLDGKTLWWADTSSYIIHAWDFDLQANTLNQHRTFATFPEKPEAWTFEDTSFRGRPDGAALDAQGNYYVAMFEGRRICKFAPTGQLLAEIPTPAQCPTMPCFGGADLKTLYITTARIGRSAAELAQFPSSGAVFSMRVDVPGLPVNFYID